MKLIMTILFAIIFVGGCSAEVKDLKDLKFEEAMAKNQELREKTEKVNSSSETVSISVSGIDIDMTGEAYTAGDIGGGNNRDQENSRADFELIAPIPPIK